MAFGNGAVLELFSQGQTAGWDIPDERISRMNERLPRSCANHLAEWDGVEVVTRSVGFLSFSC